MNAKQKKKWIERFEFSFKRLKNHKLRLKEKITKGREL